MKVYVKNYKNSYCREFDIQSFLDLDSFCTAYGISLRFKVTSDSFESNEESIKEAFLKAEPHRDIIFTFTPTVKRTGHTYLENLDIIFDDINNIYKLHDDMDKKLLGEILVYRCSYNAKVAEFLLNPLSLNFFSDKVAQEVFDTLVHTPTLLSLQYAQKLLQSKQWTVKGDFGDYDT